ncbi:fluoride efflux transporter CrcB [Agaribacterium haliotis]|uniref:fluoride efflux transporter CrcB n=1 Tax=Agaribacterium haliotis TaxID=2013869 RepID=UPI000BB57F1F|nr:fluoride efflux transporter CrcB [Agaribacterium haliotis]
MNWLAVACGGAIGACLRYSLALSFASYGFRFPIATFAANMLGCFLMGLGFVFIVEKALLSDVWRHFLLVGMLGAFTTYSTFSVEVLSLLTDHYWKTALAYWLGTAILSVLGAGLGVYVAKQLIS